MEDLLGDWWTTSDLADWIETTGSSLEGNPVSAVAEVLGNVDSSNSVGDDKVGAEKDDVPSVGEKSVSMVTEGSEHFDFDSTCSCAGEDQADDLPIQENPTSQFASGRSNAEETIARSECTQSNNIASSYEWDIEASLFREPEQSPYDVALELDSQDSDEGAPKKRNDALPGTKPAAKRKKQRIGAWEDCPIDCRVYVEPSDRDVKSGRGGNYHSRVGNISYLVAVFDMILAEPRLIHKEDLKERLKDRLIGFVHDRGGRFLRRDNRGWFVMTQATIEDKANKAFSDRMHWPTEKLIEEKDKLVRKLPEGYMVHQSTKSHAASISTGCANQFSTP